MQSEQKERAVKFKWGNERAKLQIATYKKKWKAYDMGLLGRDKD